MGTKHVKTLGNSQSTKDLPYKPQPKLKMPKIMPNQPTSDKKPVNRAITKSSFKTDEDFTSNPSSIEGDRFAKLSNKNKPNLEIPFSQFSDNQSAYLDPKQRARRDMM